MPCSPLPSLLAGLLLSIGHFASAQSEVHRCEGGNGHITYSNTPCPTGTTPVRAVSTEPPVSIEDRRAALERARRDNAALQRLDRERAQEQAQQKRAADERAKAEARSHERCERAQSELERARATHARAGNRPAKAEQRRKADLDLGRWEAETARVCAR